MAAGLQCVISLVEISCCKLAERNFASEIYSRRPANRNFLAEIASCKLQQGIFLPKSLPASLQ